MMTSLSVRTRLLIILIASTSMIWLCGFFWIFSNSQRDIQHLLDRRLMEAARMVLSLSVNGAIKDTQNLSGLMAGDGSSSIYEHRLSCQIWSLDGHLVGRSADTPQSRLTDQKEGFSEPIVDGSAYRVYAAVDEAKGIRVLVGDNLEQRNGLIRDLLNGLLLPAAFMLPIIAVLIWVSVTSGLRPLRRAADALAERDAENLTRLEVAGSPPEIQPLLGALNRLFDKVAAAREHERSFVAYAAHEMRTPLAGLKTQVQIALKTGNDQVRDGALSQAVKAVDRTSRLVTQLLAMSRLDAHSSRHVDHWIDLQTALVELTGHMSRDLNPSRVSFDASLRHVSLAFDRELFDLAARNLIENALQLSPRDGTVRLSIVQDKGEARVCVEDDGPGIPPEERELVLQRFFRGRHKSAIGSGLGLSIVTAALERAGATLRLCTPVSGQGLRAEIVFPAKRLRQIEDAFKDAAA